VIDVAVLLADAVEVNAALVAPAARSPGAVGLEATPVFEEVHVPGVTEVAAPLMSVRLRAAPELTVADAVATR